MNMLICAAMLTFQGASEPAIEKVAASDDAIVLDVSGEGGRLSIVELRPYQKLEDLNKTAREAAAVWRGEAPTRARIERHAAHDRLYSKFQLLADGGPVGHPQYVTDLSAVSARDFEMPWPEGKKGLTCVVDVDDAIATGSDIVDEGVVQSQLIDWRADDPAMSWEVDGVEVGLHERYVSHMDDKYGRFAAAGVPMLPIPVNHVPTTAQPGNPLIHPKTNLAEAPMHIGAFNLTTEEGLRCYIAMYEFMADRYTRADAQYGRIPGFVVGNELQSHWVWHNIGETPAEEVIEDYVRAVRIAWLAARSQHKDLRVFISMDHSWTHTVLDDPLKVIPGDELLRGFAKEAKRGGDFPWHVAFHPYPENLFEPRFWNDRTALMRFDTPRITFKNLEVLPEFLRQEEFLYNGELRGIALTEQGFHTPDAPDGEAVQAAAYCYAFHKVNHMPEIDAFIYHRHTSMPDEGGLDLGLWMWDPEALPEIRPGKKKRIWEVYKAAGTPDWEEAFAFALPLIGIDSWDEALPDYAIDTTPAPEMDRDRVVADLIKLKEKAVVQNSESWRTEVVVKSAGWAAKSIFQHPPEEGAGTAAFPIDLPEAEGDKLLMQFDTLLAGPSENGVEFSVRVNGAEVWRTHQTKEPSVPHEIDLTPYAGQTIELTLAVDAMGNTSYDWAHWVQPTIIRAE